MYKFMRAIEFSILVFIISGSSFFTPAADSLMFVWNKIK